MLSDFLQNQAALYVSGGMMADEREQLEAMLEFHEELRGQVVELKETAAAVALSATSSVAPSPSLKARLSELIAGRPQQTTPEALVVAGPDGFVQWVNEPFSEMCGYSLDELRGKKLGPILQGAETDQATVQRIRAAMRERTRCREKILNYHKNGTAYWVEIDLSAIKDDAGETLWLIARERELPREMAA